MKTLILLVIWSHVSFSQEQQRDKSNSTKKQNSYQNLLPTSQDLNSTNRMTAIEIWEQNYVDRAFDQCFDTYIEYHKKLYMSREDQSGFAFNDDVTIKINIDAEGKVTKALSSARQITSPVLHRCLERLALRWQLPQQLRKADIHSFSRRLQFEVRYREP